MARLSNQPLTPGQRIAARVEYHGGHYHGWQAQPHLAVPTVQETLEAALQKIAGVPLRTVCAGRTDTGVHAFGQVIHFDDPVGRSPKAWVMGTNRHLPADIRVHWAVPVATEFHARFSATARRYRYIILNADQRPALLDGLVTWERRTLDVPAMNEAAQCLLGEQDFSAFRAAHCQASTPMRCITDCSVEARQQRVVIDVTANAFLYHMVRNIAGSLMAVGIGAQSVDDFRSVLIGRDRAAAGDTAPAEGLYLVQVRYAEAFELPRIPEGPTLLEGTL